MAKIGIDKDAIIRFFSLHVEKIVLGVVVLLLVLFVYRGYSLEGLASDKRPDVLKTKAAEVKTFIENPAAQELIVSANKQETEFVARTKAGQAPIFDGGYPIELKRSTLKPSGMPRTDPEIFPPLEIEAVAISAAIAYIPARGEVDPLQDDENMEPKKAAETKKKRPRRGRDKDKDKDMMGGFSGAGGPGMPGMSGSGEGGLAGLGGLGGIPGQGEGAGSMPGGPGMGGMGASTEGMIMANPEDIEGFRPPTGALVISKHIVGVTALVPYKKQWDEFDAKLSSAMAYTKSRDVPTYLGFYAERAEVKDETDTDFTWKAISKSDYVIKQMTDGRRPYGGWAGYPQEVADLRYVAPNILTMPIPPVVSKSFDQIALHSKVPRYQQTPEIPGAGEETDAPEEASGSDDIGSAPSLSGPGPRAGYGSDDGPGMGAPGMMGGPGRQGMGGYGSGVPGMGAPGMGAPGMGAPGMGAPGMGAPGMGAPGMGAPGMGAPGMGGYGTDGGADGYGGMGGALTTAGPSVDYLMVRFFDLSISDPTKKYRYRIQLWVEDPNHPQNPLADPNVRALSPEVRTRIADVKTKEAAAKKRLYFRTTEFSEPSALVSFVQSSQTLGGEIAMERESVIEDAFNNQFRLPAAEQSAKVMSVVWDNNRAIEVPGLVNAHRGTFLNFMLDADVVHPVSLVYKTIKEFPFKTNRMVLDFMGGEPLPVPKEEQDDNPLFAPAEFLFLNEKGELFVRNELDDWDAFKKRLPPEVPAVEDGMGGPEGFGPGAGGDGPAGMVPGMGPPGGDAGADGAPGRGRGRSGRSGA